MADKPTVSWDENNPPGQQDKSLGAERMRELKIQLREIMSEDHVFESSGKGETWGYHKKLTLYIRSSNPIPDADTGCLFSKDVSSKAELHWVDEDDNDIQITSGGDTIVGLVGEVRIWSGLLANISTGWALCDGVADPLNLIGKFIRGVNTNATNPGGTGGSDFITLTSSTTPTHTHSISGGNHTHQLNLSAFNGSDTTIQGIYVMSTTDRSVVANESAHTHSPSSVVGSSAAIDNRPVYIEEAFIIKT